MDYDDYQFNDEITETSDNPLPPETYLPKPTTKSPNYQDPFYIRTKNTRIGNKGSIGGISSEYIYHKEKSGRKDSRISPDDFEYRQVIIRDCVGRGVTVVCILVRIKSFQSFIVHK